MDDPWIRRARVQRITDGDTVVLLCDLGFATHGLHPIRLLGVDAPELFSGTTEERALGAAARDFVVAWCAAHAAHAGDEPDWPLVVRTEKDKMTFNRYVGDVRCRQGHRLADDLVAAGHAVRL